MKIIFDSIDDIDIFLNSVQFAQDQGMAFCSPNMDGHCPKDKNGKLLSCVECYKKNVEFSVKKE